MQSDRDLAGGGPSDPRPKPGGTDGWGRVRDIFLSALDLPDAERPAYLARTCGADPALHAEVASLLASERAAGSFCETPAAQLLGLSGFGDDGAAMFADAPRLAPGTVLGSYEVTSFLSAGGMGAVYRARHLLLGREVAIKTVGQAGAGADARRRLLREARHAAGLDHPAICAIHEVGIADEMPYIVMPLIDGRPLSDVIRAGLPPLTDALDFGMQVAAALEHAHERGIVHRDLKSSNVLVDSHGRAIVLDFGLSRRLPHIAAGPASDITATMTGMFAGTLTHMAPEVLFGGEPDSRSDIWSLGVLLYELTTGTLPFQGRTAFETSSAILKSAPRAMPARVPLAVRLIVERCLAKDPAARYQSAAAVRAALEAVRRHRAWPLVGRLLISARRRALGRAAAVVLVLLALAAAAPRLAERMWPPAVTTLALLPLETDAGDDASAVYAAGLTDALSAQLGSAVAVRLIAATSAAIAAAETGSPAEAGRALGADGVVIGRVRLTGDRIAVDVRIIAAASGGVLWSDRFERPAGQVLALQADIVRGLADGVRLALRPGSSQRLATVRAVNPEAYEEYVKGRFEWNRRTPTSLEHAIAHFTRAIEYDPTWAPAYAALADCYNQLGTVMVGTGSPVDHRPRAVAAAIRALQIDPGSAEAHAALAYARHYDWDWSAAEQGFLRAIELNPNYALARIWYANFLMSRDRIDEALEQVLAARGLDPYSRVVATNVGWVLIQARRFDEAAAQLGLVLALDSTYSQARMRLIDALLLAGRHREAHEHAHRLLELTGDWPPALIALANVHARTGAADSARLTLASLLERQRREHVSTAGIASVFNILGDVDAALDWYRRTIDERSNAAVYLGVMVEDTPLHGDPRFRAMLAAAGLD
jgi:eukaryotic-like serine/threonine-protein kinase